MEEQTVGIGDMVLNLLVDLGIVHHGGVGTAILHWIAACDDIGRHIVGEGRSCLDQREVASTGVGILDGSAGEDDTVANLTVAGYLRAIAEHAVVAYYGVVADVGTFEQEVTVANLRHTIAVGAAVDDDVLTDDIAVANHYIRLGATEVEVLRQGGDDGALVDLVAFTDA